MSENFKRVKNTIQGFESKKPIEAYEDQLQPLNPEQIQQLEAFNYDHGYTEDSMLNRQDFLTEKGFALENLTGKKSHIDLKQLKGNIENYIGMAQIPVGIAGPLLVRGSYASGDFFIPLATTEGALVASYSRGMKACRMSGGITAVCINEGVQRSPFFKFKNIHTVGLFLKWIHNRIDTFKHIITQVSNHAQLVDLNTNFEGNSVILTFEFTTGDAAGQNMVTICTHHICQYILKEFDTPPETWYIESNYSGDKKATALSFSNVRGKKVTSEVLIPKDIVSQVLKSSPEAISAYWQSSTLAVIQSGSIGAQGHIANGLTALFIACGQDVACISESSVGITRMETTSEGDLYVSITLPSLIVGTVGGGTSLPTQKECLSLLGCDGHGTAKKFAEICCAVALAGELSIASAMAADHFTSAHQNLGRKK